MRKTLKKAAVLGTVLAAGCSCAAKVEIPHVLPTYLAAYNVERFEPSALHMVLLEEVKSCLGLKEGNFFDIEWYTHTGMRNVVSGVLLDGLQDGNEIYLLLDQIEDPFLISHELIHWVREVNGLDPGADHTQDYWSCERRKL